MESAEKLPPFFLSPSAGLRAGRCRGGEGAAPPGAPSGRATGGGVPAAPLSWCPLSWRSCRQPRGLPGLPCALGRLHRGKEEKPCSPRLPDVDFGGTRSSPGGCRSRGHRGCFSSRRFQVLSPQILSPDPRRKAGEAVPGQYGALQRVLITQSSQPSPGGCHS